MAWPYTNQEIQEIAETVARKLTGWLLTPPDSTGRRSVDHSAVSGWQAMVDMDSRDAWRAWCMYGEDYCEFTRGRGLARDMLSAEQRAMVVLSVRQAIDRAYDRCKK